MIAVFRLYPFTFLNFIFDGRDIFVAGPFPAIAAIRAIHRLADVFDPALAVIPRDDAKLAGLNFFPNPFRAKMIRYLIPVYRMNELVDQTGIFQEGIRPIPRYAFTGGGNILEIAFFTDPILPIVSKVSHCPVFFLAIMELFPGFSDFIDDILGMRAEYDEKAQNSQPRINFIKIRSGESRDKVILT